MVFCNKLTNELHPLCFEHVKHELTVHYPSRKCNEANECSKMFEQRINGWKLKFYCSLFLSFCVCELCTPSVSSERIFDSQRGEKKPKACIHTNQLNIVCANTLDKLVKRTYNTTNAINFILFILAIFNQCVEEQLSEWSTFPSNGKM